MKSMKKSYLAIAAALIALPVVAYAAPPDHKVVGLGFDENKLGCNSLIMAVDYGTRIDIGSINGTVVLKIDTPAAFGAKDLDLGLESLIVMHDRAGPSLLAQMQNNTVLDVPRVGYIESGKKEAPDLAGHKPPLAFFPKVFQGGGEEGGTGSRALESGDKSGIAGQVRVQKMDKKLDARTGSGLIQARGDDSHLLYGLTSKKKDVLAFAGHKAAAATQTIDPGLQRGARSDSHTTQT